MNVLKAPHNLLILHVGFGIKRLIAAQWVVLLYSDTFKSVIFESVKVKSVKKIC